MNDSNKLLNPICYATLRFITGEDNIDAFVHHTSIQGNGFKSLVEGDKVSFDTEKGPKGPKAINVVKM